MRCLARLDWADRIAWVVIGIAWAYLIARVLGWPGLPGPYPWLLALAGIGYGLFWAARSLVHTRRAARVLRAVQRDAAADRD